MSGHSQIDGPTEPTDLAMTEENKAIVRSFVTEVLVSGAFDKLDHYISTETYIQHNPQIADGVEGLQAFIASFAEQGVSFAYEEVHNVIGCGDFVAVLAKMRLGGDEMAVIDLFRVNDRRIVEHWDVIEPIPPRDELVNTGKF